VSFPDDAFVAVVLAHGAWYFDSLDQLSRTLERVQGWATRLCFAEWDLEPATLDQVAHLLAVLIQGQVEGYKRESDANVRKPFSRTRLLDLVSEAGWMVSEEFRVDMGNLRDADWELGHCLTSSLSEVGTIDIPPRIRTSSRVKVTSSACSRATRSARLRHTRS
jgi:hypothetical protein